MFLKDLFHVSPQLPIWEQQFHSWICSHNFSVLIHPYPKLDFYSTFGHLALFHSMAYPFWISTAIKRNRWVYWFWSSVLIPTVFVAYPFQPITCLDYICTPDLSILNLYTESVFVACFRSFRIWTALLSMLQNLPWSSCWLLPCYLSIPVSKHCYCFLTRHLFHFLGKVYRAAHVELQLLTQAEHSCTQHLFVRTVLYPSRDMP